MIVPGGLFPVRGPERIVTENCTGTLIRLTNSRRALLIDFRIFLVIKASLSSPGPRFSCFQALPWIFRPALLV